jgi:AraC-like DNA-binding protein
MLQTFTTKASTRFERSRQWCARTQAHHVEFNDDREASMRGGEFGTLRLCIVSMGRHRVVQSPQAAQQAAPELKFLLQEEGAAIIRQADSAQRLEPGNWCVLRKDLPFELEAPDHARQLAITIPCDLLPALTDRPTARTFRRGPAQILHACALAAIMTAAHLDQAQRQQIGEQLTRFLQMAIEAGEMDALPNIREERRRAILSFIDRHLDDPDLSVARIARAFDMSTRSIHKLFEGEAHTVARAIWDRRLERCRDEMVDPSLAARSITEIAHLWGFSDSQHFSRAFKQRFGLPPRLYRSAYPSHCASILSSRTSQVF